MLLAGGLVDMGSGHLHRLTSLGEARVREPLEVRIFEHSPVLEADPWRGRCKCAAQAAACAQPTWCWHTYLHLEELEPRLSG